MAGELLTLLRMRGESQRALRLGEALLAGEIAALHWVSREDVFAAWDVYRQFSDKQWSFTDCVSKVVMARRDIRTTFAFDAHFRQFGTVTVVPGGLSSYGLPVARMEPQRNPGAASQTGTTGLTAKTWIPLRSIRATTTVVERACARRY